MICLLDEQQIDHRQGGHHAAGRSAGHARSGQQGGGLLSAASMISERHRHRYEFNNVYRQQFAANGMLLAGTSPDGSLVEMIELPRPPVVRGRAIPSGIQVEADRGPPAVCRLYRRGGRAAFGTGKRRSGA